MHSALSGFVPKRVTTNYVWEYLLYWIVFQMIQNHHGTTASQLENTSWRAWFQQLLKKLVDMSIKQTPFKSATTFYSGNVPEREIQQHTGSINQWAACLLHLCRSHTSTVLYLFCLGHYENSTVPVRSHSHLSSGVIPSGIPKFSLQRMFQACDGGTLNNCPEANLAVNVQLANSPSLVYGDSCDELNVYVMLGENPGIMQDKSTSSNSGHVSFIAVRSCDHWYYKSTYSCLFHFVRMWITGWTFQEFRARWYHQSTKIQAMSSS